VIFEVKQPGLILDVKQTGLILDVKQIGVIIEGFHCVTDYITRCAFKICYFKYIILEVIFEMANVAVSKNRLGGLYLLNTKAAGLVFLSIYVFQSFYLFLQKSQKTTRVT